MCPLSGSHSTAERHVYHSPYGRWAGEDGPLPWNSMSFALFSALLPLCGGSPVTRNQSFFWGGVRWESGSSSQLHRADCLLLCWLRSATHTQSMKSVDSWGHQGPVFWSAPRSLTDLGEKGTAPSAGQGHWSDEKIIHPPLPATADPPAAAGPHAASNHLWAVTEPDWAERIWVGNFKTCSCFCGRERICITHSDLMDFPMFALDSPFCWHVQIMNLLCVGSLFPPLLLSPVSSCRVGMLCGPFPRLSRAYGVPLTRWLPGTRVSGSACCRATVSLYTSQEHLMSELETLTTNMTQLFL